MFFALWTLAASGAGAREAPRGEAIFKETCAACHTLGAGRVGGGRAIGPDLLGVASRRRPDWLRTQLQHPSQHPDNDPIARVNRRQFGFSMPDLELSDEEVEAVIAYLEATQRAPAALPSPYLLTVALAGVVGILFTLIGLRGGAKEVEVRP